MPVLVVLNYVQLCPQQYHNTSFSTSTMWAIAVCPGFSLTNNNEFHQENLKPSWFSVQSVQSRAITAVSCPVPHWSLHPKWLVVLEPASWSVSSAVSSSSSFTEKSDLYWHSWPSLSFSIPSTHLQTERTRGLQCPASAGCSSSSSWSWRNLRLKVLITVGSFCVNCVLSFWNTKVRCWTMFTRHFAHGVVWKVWENRVPQEITLVLPKKSHSFFPKYFFQGLILMIWGTPIFRNRQMTTNPNKWTNEWMMYAGTDE